MLQAEFQTAHGVVFRAVVVEPNEAIVLRHGRPAVRNEYTKPVVKFFDTRHDHGPFGQFVSDYFIETLIEGARDRQVRGLILWDTTPAWRLDAQAYQRVIDWLKIVDWFLKVKGAHHHAVL